MARISGVDLPKEKRLVIGLTYIFGIGNSVAKRICTMTGISEDKRVKDLTEDESAQIRRCINENFKVEGNLRTEIQMNIKRLKDIGCYRGLRHRKGLPARGQRTKTNARTLKGKRKTVGRKKKK